ncbi:hypothetical protein PanABDRAFT_3521 [Pantoea sp. aB]|nr:hypothetical protein PanABDRAFT_3521 [Pantoea sp. aB]
MRIFTRLVGLVCLWGILVAQSYSFTDKSLFYVEVVAIIAWIISEIDWYKKDKNNI